MQDKYKIMLKFINEMSENDSMPLTRLCKLSRTSRKLGTELEP